MASPSLPSTLTGPPVAALVPPKMCQFTEEFTAVPLLQSFKVSETTKVFRFGLPDVSQPLNLSTCACILAKADLDGECIIRPYTPISTNADVGYFDLLVKHYGPTAHMSRHLHDTMQVGDKLEFKHIAFNVKIQPEEFMKYDEILMLVGGTGVTPMVQALHAMLGSSSDAAKQPVVTMLYGSRVSSDILGNEILQAWAKDYPQQFKLTNVLSHEPAESSWTGARGFITKDMIAASFPPADTDKKVLIFVCGPPPMYNVFCGPREEQDKVTGILGEMGFGPNQVYKF